MKKHLERCRLSIEFIDGALGLDATLVWHKSEPEVSIWMEWDCLDFENAEACADFLDNVVLMIRMAREQKKRG